jgi:hypothetical protein
MLTTKTTTAGQEYASRELEDKKKKCLFASSMPQTVESAEQTTDIPRSIVKLFNSGMLVLANDTLYVSP